MTASSRIQAKLDATLLPEWKNIRQFKAKIIIPNGATINVGAVEPQVTKSETLFNGGADQMLMPQSCSESWIVDVRGIRGEMKETDLIDLLRETLNELKQTQAVRGGTDLRSIIENYERVVMLLLGGNLTDNLIRFSPREYLEVYSDYENPLFEKMDCAQRKVNDFLVVRP